MPASRLRLGACLTAFAIGCTAVAAPAAAAGRPPASSLPSIVAEHVRLHGASGIEFARVRIELSPDGMRLRARRSRSDLEVIQDFVGDRLWFVDRNRRVVHALDRSDAEVSGAVTLPDDPFSRGSFLGTVPCAGGPSRRDGGGQWRGRDVDVWQCRDVDDAPLAIEFMDREHGIVVRRATLAGYVDELRDVRSMRFPPNHFAPSTRFRPVEEGELLRGAPPIADFDEDARS